MGLSFRQGLQIARGMRLTFSKRGAGVSYRVGPFSLTTRRRATVRVAPGLSFRKLLRRK